MNARGLVFRGRFVRDGDETVLCGAFELPRAQPFFAALWFAVGIVFTATLPLIGAFGAAQEGLPWLLGLIAGGIMACTCVGLLLIGAALLAYQRWQDRVDVTEIEQHIASTLVGDQDD